MYRYWISFFCLLFFLRNVNSATIGTKDEIDILKEQVNQLKDSLTAIEKTTEEEIKKLEKISSEDRASFSENIKDLSEQIRSFLGKLNEVENKLYETIEQEKKEQEGKNIEFRRDIESSKKFQNDLLVSLSSFNQNISTLQNELLNIKKSQIEITNAIEKIYERIAKVESSFEEQKNGFNQKIEVLLNEIVRQESEIFLLKAKIPEQIEKKAISKTVTSEVKEEMIEYIVKAGDTLTTIGEKFNVSVETLQKINNLKGTTISIGQKLKIPAKK